jgi:WD40 repeat protein/serine/threonine protein kinase
MTLSNGDQRAPPAPPEGVDAICDAFEAAWLAGQEPRIEDFLPRDEPVHKDVLLRELLLAEWDLRRRHEQHVELETYLERFLESRRCITELWHDWQAKQSEGSLDGRANGLATATRSPPAVEQGTVIGRYKLLEKLGEGGFGTVWAAEQREPVKRRVALKVIKLGMDTRQVIARFEAERQALALMDHPNIAKVLDAGATETGGPYFVMELVRGTPITTYCEQERLSIQDRLDLFIKVCNAIQHAHQKGIIHRDVKPSNILVTLHDGVPVPKVIDFGIAKAIQQELTEKTIYTQLQQFIGTPAYMSPEQAEMSGLDIDTRSDIYSLGVLLYELLTGATPFDAKELMSSGLDAMRKIIREREPLKPSSRLTKNLETANRSDSQHTALPGALEGPHSAIDRDLDWIVMKCLEKDRTRRYETASALAADLKRHLKNEPVTARPPSAAYRLQKAWRRNKLVYAAGVAVLVALAVGLTLAAFGWLQALSQRDAAVLARAGEETQRKQAELATDETRRRAYAAEISAAFQALDENNLERAIDLLDRQRPKPGEEDLRGFEWRHLWQLCQSDVKDTLPDADAQHPTFSPDGRWLAYGGKRIVIRELPSQAVVTTIPNAATTLAFSPDGKLLASGHDSHVKLWSTESWQEEQSLPDVRYPAIFSPDGQWLVTGEAGGYRVWSHPAQGAPGARTWQRGGFCPGEPNLEKYLWQSEHGVAFSPDGRLLVTAGHKGGYFAGQFQVWDFPSLTLRPGFSPQLFELASAVFTPDSKYLLIGDQIGQLIVWDVAEGRIEKTLNEHTGGITTITFARDGRTMATSSRDRTLVVWDWETRGVLVRLRGHLGQILSSAISPDGRMLASGSSEGTIRLWDPSTRHEGRMGPGCAVIIGFSTDSRQLLVRSYKECRVWRLEDGEVTTVPLTNFVYRNNDPWADVHGIEPYAAFGMANGVLEHWNLATMSRVASWQVHEGAVSTAEFSPDGRLIATSGANGDVRLWDRKTHREVRRFKALGKKVRCLAFSPDGRLLAGSEGSYNDPQVCIWDVNAGSLLRELNGVTGLGPSLAFSPDGKLLATPHYDSIARLWEIPSGNLKATLKGHAGHVIGVAFSPDGKTLATGSYERKLKLWNIATQQEVATLEPLPGSCLTLRFSPDGHILAAGSWMGSEPYTSLWEAPSFEEIAAAEATLKTGSKQP